MAFLRSRSRRSAFGNCSTARGGEYCILRFAGYRIRPPLDFALRYCVHVTFVRPRDAPKGKMTGTVEVQTFVDEQLLKGGA